MVPHAPSPTTAPERRFAGSGYMPICPGRDGVGSALRSIYDGGMAAPRELPDELTRLLDKLG